MELRNDADSLLNIRWDGKLKLAVLPWYPKRTTSLLILIPDISVKGGIKKKTSLRKKIIEK